MKNSIFFGQKQAGQARAAPASSPLMLPAIDPSASCVPAASYPLSQPILGQKLSQKLGFSQVKLSQFRQVSYLFPTKILSENRYLAFSRESYNPPSSIVAFFLLDFNFLVSVLDKNIAKNQVFLRRNLAENRQLSYLFPTKILNENRFLAIA